MIDEHQNLLDSNLMPFFTPGKTHGFRHLTSANLARFGEACA